MKDYFTKSFINNALTLLLFVTMPITLFLVVKCQSITSSGMKSDNTTPYEITSEYSDVMITDPEEKKAMIHSKIKSLEEANQLFWGDVPSDKSTLHKGFRNTCKYIRDKFPGFHGIIKTKDNLDGLDWDKFVAEGHKKIDKIDNYGEFIRLITLTGYILQEGHTEIYTRKMIGDDQLKIFDKNAPIFRVTPVNRIGGCCIVTEDEEIVITNQINHKQNPYKLRAGDEIIGFNGIPWTEWYPILLESNIPISGSPGSSDGAIRYNLLKSAMSNVNLFETINIKRFDTNKIETMNVVYIPFTQKEYEPCLDYIGEVPGVNTPKVSSVIKNSEVMTSGIITDDNIGYIYLTLCPAGLSDFDDLSQWNPYETVFSDVFADEINKMKGTDGIIIDLRYNVGGRNDTLYKGLAKLIDIDHDIDLFTMLRRNRRNPDLLALRLPNGLKEAPLKYDNENYDKPIVVLTGPDCMSACDFLVALFSKFDEFTIIGTHNNGSFTGVAHSKYSINEDVIYKYIPLEVGAFVKQPIDLLLRRSDFVDEFIWQTKDSVRFGIDRVRDRAIEIIKAGK